MAANFSLMNDQGFIRETFSIGETVFVSGNGLTALAAVTLTLDRGAREPEVLARYVSDRHGCLPITPLIPYLGLLSPERGRVTYDDAVTAVGAKSYAVQIASEAAAGPTKQTLTFEVNENDGEARVFSSDPHGRLVTGVETSSAEVGVMLRNFPPGCVRVFAVRRQFGWRVGDPIGPVKSRAGAPVMVTTKVEEGKPRCQIAPSAKSR